MKGSSIYRPLREVQIFKSSPYRSFGIAERKVRPRADLSGEAGGMRTQKFSSSAERSVRGGDRC